MKKFGLFLCSATLFLSGPGSDRLLSQDNEARSPIYPFDVKVGEETAKLDGSIQTAIFARLAQPLPANAVIELSTKPTMVIVNVFRSDEKGVVSQADQAAAKIIMVQNGTKFGLDQTMDQSKLEPGHYAMNIVARELGTSRILFQVGDGKKMAAGAAQSKPTEAVSKAIDQSKPETVLQAVFDCARSGELAKLKPLQSSDADGDVERVCSVADAPDDAKAEFAKFFAKGKIEGQPRVEGNKAAIDFLFGPDGTKTETMNLVNEGGKWFLDSF